MRRLSSLLTAAALLAGWMVAPFPVSADSMEAFHPVLRVEPWPLVVAGEEPILIQVRAGSSPSARWPRSMNAGVWFTSRHNTYTWKDCDPQVGCKIPWKSACRCFSLSRDLTAASHGSESAHVKVLLYWGPNPEEQVVLQSSDVSSFNPHGRDLIVEAVVPIPTAAPKTGAGGMCRYTVQRGDTMSAIAISQHVPLAALLAANPTVSNPNLIYPGQVINLPCSVP